MKLTFLRLGDLSKLIKLLEFDVNRYVVLLKHIDFSQGCVANLCKRFLMGFALIIGCYFDLFYFS